MGDDGSPDKPRGTGPRSALSADEVRAFTERAPRSKVVVAVLFTPEQGAGAAADARRLVTAELVNVSSSGMFVSSSRLFEVGTPVRFQFKLDDGRWR